MNKNKSHISGPDSASAKPHVAEAETPAGKDGTPDPPVRPEIRIELVEKFKGSLRSGNYKVKAPEIAEKIVQKIRENKHGPIV